MLPLPPESMPDAHYTFLDINRNIYVRITLRYCNTVRAIPHEDETKLEKFPSNELFS